MKNPNTTRAIYDLLKSAIPELPASARRIVLTLDAESIPTVECTFFPAPAELDVTTLASSSRTFALQPRAPVTQRFDITEGVPR